MKALLIAESRDGKLLASSYEPYAFAREARRRGVTFLVGSAADLPQIDGPLYLAEAARCGDYNPALHKALLLQVVEKERPDLVVFSHSSYGWDLAPRLALALKAAQVSEVVGFADGAFVVPACNAKLRRTVKPQTPLTVVTLQAGAFSPAELPTGTPQVTGLTADAATSDWSFSATRRRRRAGST